MSSNKKSSTPMINSADALPAAAIRPWLRTLALITLICLCALLTHLLL